MIVPSVVPVVVITPALRKDFTNARTRLSLILHRRRSINAA